jgi:hypothetical protein
MCFLKALTSSSILSTTDIISLSVIYFCLFKATLNSEFNSFFLFSISKFNFNSSLSFYKACSTDGLLDSSKINKYFIKLNNSLSILSGFFKSLAYFEIRLRFQISFCNSFLQNGLNFVYYSYITIPILHTSIFSLTNLLC